MDEYLRHPSLVTYWRDGALEPWPEAAAATETVWFPLPEGPDSVRYWEGLNGRPENDGTFTVLGVPAYAYDLNLEDRVTVVRSAEGPWRPQGLPTTQATTPSGITCSTRTTRRPGIPWPKSSHPWAA
jgi:hypothetical protein